MLKLALLAREPAVAGLAESCIWNIDALAALGTGELGADRLKAEHGTHLLIERLS